MQDQVQEQRVQKKPTLYLSISVIILYWIYVFFTAQQIPELPKDLTGFVWVVVKVKVIAFSITYLLLRMEGQGFKEMGFSAKSLGKQILYGVLFGLATFVIVQVVANIIGSLITTSGKGADMSVYFKDFKSLLIWILIGIIGGGFQEEFQRIFILTRFRNLMGKPGLIISLLISSFAFGVGHLYQGLALAIGAGLGGLLNGLVYLRKYSAIEAIACHAFFDVIGVVLLYMMTVYKH